MHNESHAIQRLVALTEEYASSLRDGNTALIEQLGLFVKVRELQSMASPTTSLFISEVSASLEPDKKGIVVTCVGLSSDMPAAISSAVGQWVMGVLPALAKWRGGHSCLSASQTIQSSRGEFESLSGPVISRGTSTTEDAPSPHVADFSNVLHDELSRQPLAPRVHWLESFACKSNDGSVDATCRLDNRDWKPGQSLLKHIAQSWPENHQAMQTCRQFAIFLPKDGDANRIVFPTLWQRLTGRG